MQQLSSATDVRFVSLDHFSCCCWTQVAMTMPPPSAERQQVVIPAQGMIDIRDALTDILSEFGVSYSFGEML